MFQVQRISKHKEPCSPLYWLISVTQCTAYAFDQLGKLQILYIQAVMASSAELQGRVPGVMENLLAGILMVPLLEYL